MLALGLEHRHDVARRGSRRTPAACAPASPARSARGPRCRGSRSSPALTGPTREERLRERRRALAQRARRARRRLTPSLRDRSARAAAPRRDARSAGSPRAARWCAARRGAAAGAPASRGRRRALGDERDEPRDLAGGAAARASRSDRRSARSATTKSMPARVPPTRCSSNAGSKRSIVVVGAVQAREVPQRADERPAARRRSPTTAPHANLPDGWSARPARVQQPEARSGTRPSDEQQVRDVADPARARQRPGSCACSSATRARRGRRGRSRALGHRRDRACRRSASGPRRRGRRTSRS